MPHPIHTAQYSIVSLLFLALFVLNLYVWQYTWLGALLLVFFFVFYGRSLGRRLAPQESLLGKTVFGSAGLLAALSIYGTVLYYVDLLNQTSLAVAVILIPLLLSLRQITLVEDSTETRARWHRVPGWVAAATTLALLIGVSLLQILTKHQITEAVRSPWHVIPPAFFIGMFLFAFIVVILSWRGKERAFTLLGLTGFLFLLVAVALIAYPLGYGFDGFIHQATEQHIFEHGTITPKPFYYIGQYALTLLGAHAFFLPISFADKLLVPILSTLLLPAAAYLGFLHLATFLCKKRTFSLQRILHPENHAAKLAIFATLTIFLFPLSSFITTTPQALANLWVILTLLSSVPLLVQKSPHIPLKTPALFAAAALLTHPLSGIPALIYVTLLAVKSFAPPNVRTVMLGVIAVLGAVSLPAVFLVNQHVSGLPIQVGFALDRLNPTTLFHVNFFAENRFDSILDAAYLWGWNQPIILLVLFVLGLLITKRFNLPRAMHLPTLMAGILLVNIVVLRVFFEFSFVIDYERGDYTNRLLVLMTLFLLPMVGLAIMRLRERLMQSPRLLQLGVALVISGTLTAAVYATYPRHDNYALSRGFNVAAADVATVRSIDQQAPMGSYVVLANQAVSSAALTEFGFSTYFDDIYFYPIPTSSPLYTIYLNMVQEGPTRTRAIDAMDLVGVDTVYLVINDYWFQADTLVEDAKRNADNWYAVLDGSVHVFQFTR